MTERPDRRAALRSGLWVGWWLAVAGLVLGVVWRLVAPVARIRIESDGGYFADPSPRQFVEADIWFGALMLAAGVVAGVLVWRLVRSHPTALVVGLAAGGVLGGVLAWLVGKYLGRLDQAAALKAPVGSIVRDRLDLGAKGLIGVLPIAAVAVWLALDLLAQRRERPALASPDEEQVPGSEPVSDPADA
jgi:hypothetical protein